MNTSEEKVAAAMEVGRAVSTAKAASRRRLVESGAEVAVGAGAEGSGLADVVAGRFRGQRLFLAVYCSLLAQRARHILFCSLGTKLQPMGSLDS